MGSWKRPAPRPCPGGDHLPTIPTDKPYIVIAKPPRQIRPGRKAAAPARIVVGAKTETISAEEHARRGEAADLLFQEIKRRVAEQRKP